MPLPVFKSDLAKSYPFHPELIDVLNRKLGTELRQLAELQHRYRLLKQEHELLKKAIRFCSEARRRSLPSSTLRVASSRSARYVDTTV